MAEHVSRAVAEPNAILWAPIELAGLNFMVWAFLCFIGIVVANVNPIVPLVFAVGCHAVLSGWGAREPHLASLLIAAAAHLQPTRSFAPRKGRSYAP
jgi:type IV secretory pathway VirB3-like protein